MLANQTRYAAKHPERNQIRLLPCENDFSCALFTRRSPSQHPWREIEDGVEGQPCADHEIPVHAVIADIREAPSLDRPGEHQHGEDDSIQYVSQQMRRMEP